MNPKRQEKRQSFLSIIDNFDTLMLHERTIHELYTFSKYKSATYYVGDRSKITSSSTLVSRISYDDSSDHIYEQTTALLMLLDTRLAILGIYREIHQPNSLINDQAVQETDEESSILAGFT